MICGTCGSELKECTISGLTSDGPERFLVCEDCGRILPMKEESKGEEASKKDSGDEEGSDLPDWKDLTPCEGLRRLYEGEMVYMCEFFDGEKRMEGVYVLNEGELMWFSRDLEWIPSSYLLIGGVMKEVPNKGPAGRDLDGDKRGTTMRGLIEHLLKGDIVNHGSKCYRLKDGIAQSAFMYTDEQLNDPLKCRWSKARRPNTIIPLWNDTLYIHDGVTGKLIATKTVY